MTEAGKWTCVTVTSDMAAKAIMDRLDENNRERPVLLPHSERHVLIDRSVSGTHVFYLSPQAFALIGADLVGRADRIEPTKEPLLGGDLQWIHP